MMKVFISQPMKGKTNEEIKAEREILINNAKKAFGSDIEIINSFIENVPHDANPMWFLGESIKKLSEADVAYFAKDYENARGCKIEYDIALAYNVPNVIICYNY